jgi:hypothetical protein
VGQTRQHQHLHADAQLALVEAMILLLPAQRKVGGRLKGQGKSGQIACLP